MDLKEFIVRCSRDKVKEKSAGYHEKCSEAIISYCKLCGKAVTSARVMHAECWKREARELAEIFCDRYCRWPTECENADELVNEHCDDCHMIRVLNLGL